MDDDDDGRKRDKEEDREAAGRSVGRTNEREMREEQARTRSDQEGGEAEG